MLTITVHGPEFFDNETQTFITKTEDDVVLELEHSLVSLSKWESKFERAFLASETKSTEDTLSYIECMNLTPEISPEVFSRLSSSNLAEITNYIEAKMTATWFSEIKSAPRSSEIITSELIYYWLVAFNIPFECETWHLNRLFTLIKVCNIKNAKPKKMSRSEIAERNRELNAQRRAQHKSSG